ncbi:beta-N-acetylhexosaminidase [Bacillus sp. JJ1533]|uniref:beta-N-acetylhexosaminidase n=1 Tax=Bacillus sp. JJ1533 TaxID=3122959 RepID=UPI002FFF3F35
MRICFDGDLTELESGLTIMGNELGFNREDNGFPITIVKKEGPIVVSSNGLAGRIEYQEKIHFFRALGLWLEEYQRNHEFLLQEEPQFISNGIMVDASRNAVMTVDGIQTLVRKMALMGLNLLMMYTEDTFTVKNYPYFGYMRGRYSEDELRACDDYAHQFGIEMVPCIQTLAHLTEALKWNYAAAVRDTSDILLVGHEETYKLIDDLLVAASAPFRSKRIHIGMDEAHMLGLGKYLEQNGFRRRFDIMNEHLQQVVSLAEERGLKPMIWSDMYFRLGSKTGNYYDLEAAIPEEVVKEIPQNVQLVYWDYYHDDVEFYQTFIQKHRQLGSEPVFAGGVWTWNGIAPNYGKTNVTTEAALTACKNEGIKEVFATMWGDNGAETDSFAMLAGLQLFAEHGYAEKVEKEKLARRFAFCTGGKLEDFYLLNEFDETPGVSKHNLKESHPSKFLLWQDLLIGLYDANIHGLQMNEHYQKLESRLSEAKDRNLEWSELFEFYIKLANVLSIKAEFGIKLKQAYDSNNKEEMKSLQEQLIDLRYRVECLRRAHRTLWFSTYKPFGWEVLDIRYGGVLTRIETAGFRIGQWLDGAIPRISELEEERLFHDAPWKMPEGALGRNSYHRIVTAGAFSS